MVLLHQLSFAIKNQLGHPKPPTRGFFLILAGSFWYKAAYNRFFPCMAATYPWFFIIYGIRKLA